MRWVGGTGRRTRRLVWRRWLAAHPPTAAAPIAPLVHLHSVNRSASTSRTCTPLCPAGTRWVVLGRLGREAGRRAPPSRRHPLGRCGPRRRLTLQLSDPTARPPTHLLPLSSPAVPPARHRGPEGLWQGAQGLPLLHRAQVGRGAAAPRAGVARTHAFGRLAIGGKAPSGARAPMPASSQLRDALVSSCAPTPPARRPPSQEAEVIFCPYSYLIDPVIRRAMAVGAPPPAGERGAAAGRRWSLLRLGLCRAPQCPLTSHQPHHRPRPSTPSAPRRGRRAAGV